MKAAIYSRKSKFTGKGESVENQIQWCREYGMKKLGITEADFEIYEDEGFSGGNTNRPQFRNMMKDARSGKFDIVICYRLDRISRNVSDFSQLVKDLNNFSINFVSIREQFDTTTPMGRAMMYIASVFSQLERETIAERIRDNMLQLAKSGRWLGGTPPTGYKSEAVVATGPDGKKRKMYRLAPVAEEIKVIRLIYDKYIRLESIAQVEKYLAENNICTKNGQDFHRYSIRSILSNPVYAVADKTLYDYLARTGYDVYADPEDFNGVNGLTGYNKTGQNKGDNRESYRDRSEWIIAVGLHEGIIPGHRWIAAQEMLSNNKSRALRKVKASQALLSGLLYCAECGSPMRPKSVRRYDADNEQVFYYLCELKEKSRKSRCNISNINGNLLDKSVLLKINEITAKYPPLLDDSLGENELIGRNNAALGEYEVLMMKLAEMEAGIKNLAAVIAKGQNAEGLSVILNKMEGLTKDKEGLKKRIVQMQDAGIRSESNELNPEIAAVALEALKYRIWELMGPYAKRSVIKSAVDRIVWDGTRLELILVGGGRG